MDVDKCPFCFRPHGRWQKDPILLPNGCPNEWVSATETTLQSDIDERIYKGTCQICEAEIQEIQDFLKQTEIDNSITPLTTWSPLNMSGKFQILGKHIKEMRDSVEKLLTNFGLTKTDYFNYDEEGNEITQPNGQKLDWTDPITNAVDLKQFQVKAIHIEDLRHYIQTFWQETWAGAHTIGTSSIVLPPGEDYVIVNPALYGDDNWWTQMILNLWEYDAQGGIGGSTSAEIVCSNNFGYNSFVERSHTTAFDHTFAAISSLEIEDYVPYGILTPNTNFIIDSLICTIYTKLYGSDGALSPFPYPISALNIKVVFASGKAIKYIFGTTNLYFPPWIPTYPSIVISATSFSGIFQRNIYNDFLAFYGIPVAEEVTQIGAIISCVATTMKQDNPYDTTGWFSEEAGINVVFTKMSIRNIVP